MGIWQNLTRLGGVFGVLSVGCLISGGVKWNFALMIYAMFFLFVGLLQQFVINELPPE